MFSIVTPNRNRLEHLKQALPSWQQFRLISEIVVVDYGSDRAIRIDDFATADKLKIVRVEGTVDWRIGHASNIGIDFASREKVFKLDSDIILDDGDWLEKVDLTDRFYRGHFQTPVPNGEVIFLKDHWRAVGGYHEWLSGYGFDDGDFYIRLRAHGLAESHLPASLLHTISHSQELRGSYKSTYRFGSIDDAQTRADFDQRKNTLLSFMQRWQPSLRTPYKVLSENEQLITVKSDQVRDRSASQDVIAETISALYLKTSDQAVRHQLGGLMGWLIEQAGGHGRKPEGPEFAGAAPAASKASIKPATAPMPARHDGDARRNEYSSVDILCGNNTTRKLYFRAKSSDELVINQIFQQRPYDLGRLSRSAELKAYLDRQKSGGKRPLIVDAGANIGASSVFFTSLVPDAKVVAIEPDAGNFRLLALNSDGLHIDSMEAALSSAHGHMRLVDPGQGHWGYRTEFMNGAATADGHVRCVTIDDIYGQYAEQCFPFIVKVDIEGGEADLFSANTDWVKQTPILIIELHDWMLTKSANSQAFLRCISTLNRDFVYAGGEDIFSIANDLA